MPQELKALTINLKSLDQDIPDPITVGGANANGRTFRIIFSQEAAAQLSDDTVVYLKWKHLQKNIQGYEAFVKVSDDPVCWEIKWSTQMMRCGTGEVICDVELVDDISIAPTQTFLVHILEDPHDGSNFVVSDNFTVFQQAVIHLTTLADKIEDQSAKFEEMENELNTIKEEAQKVVYDIDDRLKEKLDISRAGFDFSDEIPTIKTYIDTHTIAHGELIEFVGEDE